ncbi:unnamed protein product [Aphanomyces euteiches]
MVISHFALDIAMVATIRKPAPAFTAEAVINGRFEEVSLKDYLGQYVVLFFYPLDFTFVCPTEIIAFSDRIEDFKKLNTAVLAASVDSKFSHLAWIKHPRNDGGLGEMKIPVISDITKKISKDYGVLIEDDADADNGVALRGLFIIDTKGVLRQITINDLPVGRNVDEILRLVEAFQYTDEFGEVCPANWTAGKATMVANPEDSKSYFKANH